MLRPKHVIRGCQGVDKGANSIRRSLQPALVNVENLHANLLDDTRRPTGRAAFCVACYARHVEDPG